MGFIIKLPVLLLSLQSPIERNCMAKSCVDCASLRISRWAGFFYVGVYIMLLSRDMC